MEVTNKYATFKTQVEGAPKESDFEFKTSPLALWLEPGSNEIIVKNLYVSIDPYQLNRMKSWSSSHKAIPGLSPGQFTQLVQDDAQTLHFVLNNGCKEMVAYGVAKVVVSENGEYEKGDLVVGVITWAEYAKIGSNVMIRKLEPMGFPLSYYTGILGVSGLAAYRGFFDICKPKAGEKVFVSAASGSIGNLVGQYAKSFGCHIVGCAGSKRKVLLLKETLGFNDAFNYKEQTDLKSTLKRYFPDGIDIYFDNVGGEMLEAAIVNMNDFGRVAACGLMSEYTDSGKRAAPNMIDVIYKRIKIQGFLAHDFLGSLPDFISTTSELLWRGEIHPLEDISNGLESIPSAFVGLFRGDNVGKKVVRIAAE